MLEIALYIKNKFKKCPLYSYPLIRISRGESADNKPRIYIFKPLQNLHERNQSLNTVKLKREFNVVCYYLQN